METKDKLFNFRPIVFSALALCFGAFLASLIFTHGFQFVYLILASLIIIVFVAVVKFEVVENFFVKHFIFIILALLLFVFGIFAFIINVKSYENKRYSNQEITATATISKIGKSYVLISNVKADKFYSNNSGNYEYNYNFDGSYYCYPENYSPDDFRVGDNIKVVGKITFFDVVSSKNEINSGVVYNHNYGSFYNANITKLGTTSKTDLFMELRNNVNQMLHENMDNDSASVAYSMLFGDKGELSEEIVEDFKTTGILHLLAVSGLHIGFLVALISVALKAMKVRPKIRAGVVIALCFIYAWVCGFTPSVTRAMVMTAVILMAGIGRKQYDMMNALAVSIILILVFNIGSLFHIGFQLSVMSVLFISFFGLIVKRILSKFLPEAVASALAITLCTQLGTLPILMDIYGSYSVVSIIANLIIVPIASLAFEITFVSLIILLIIPSIGLILKFSQLFFDFIIMVARLVSNVQFLTNLTFGWFQFIILIVCTTALSQYIFLKRKTKLVFLFILFIDLLTIFGGNLNFVSI